MPKCTRCPGAWLGYRRSRGATRPGGKQHSLSGDGSKTAEFRRPLSICFLVSLHNLQSHFDLDHSSSYAHATRPTRSFECFTLGACYIARYRGLRPEDLAVLYLAVAVKK